MFIFIDFETHLINEESPIPKPICLSYFDGKNKGIFLGKEIDSFLKDIFKSNSIKIGAHNSAFELNVITKYYTHLKSYLYKKLEDKKIICTKIYEQLLDCIRKKNIKSFSLDSLVLNYFNIDISENKKDPNAWRLRYHELENIPLKDWPQAAIEYAENDSVYAYQIYLKQIEEKKIDTSLSVEADYYLNRMGMTGINIDQIRVSKIEEELKDQTKEDVEILKQANILVPGKTKLKRNMKEFRNILKKSISTIRYTTKDSVSTSKEDIYFYLSTLNKEDKLYPILNSFINIMAAEKALTAFISRLKKASPYIRTQYKAVVSSGRTASSTTKNFPSVNIQQMPRELKGTTWDIRNCFIPREGYKLCAIDYNTYELASASNQLYKITGQREMLDILNSGDVPVDIHSMLAYRFMNMKEQLNETYESFIKHKKEPRYKQYRQLAKPINLGFPGGIGYETMRILLARYGIYPKLLILDSSRSENKLQLKANILKKKKHPVRVRQVRKNKFELIYDELVALKDEMFNLYPDLKNFLTEGHKEFLTGQSKSIKNEFGEWEKEDMYSYQVGDFSRDWCTYTQLCNGILMQSPTAIGAKKAVIDIMRKYCDSNLIIPQAFIHDEILFEVKNCENIYSLIKDVSTLMLQAARSVLPDVRIAVEAELMDYWSKSGGYWNQTYWINSNSSNVYSH